LPTNLWNTHTITAFATRKRDFFRVCVSFKINIVGETTKTIVELYGIGYMGKYVR